MSHLEVLRRSGEAVTYAALAVAGLVAALVAVGYGVFAEGGRVGPGFLPLAAGLVTAILCGACAARALRTSGREVDDAAVHGPAKAAGPAGADDYPDIDTTGRTEGQRVRNLWVVFGLTLVCIAIVPVLGFLLAFGLLVLVISTAVERQSLVRSLAISAMAVGVVYGVFGLFLSVPLPGGLLGLGTEG